jgi:hypothetical protein
MATEEKRKRSDEGGSTDNSSSGARSEPGDIADRAQEDDPNTEVKRQIDTGEENAA